MIDMHCHILPGIDDGAKDNDVSLEMLKTAEGDGIDTIIATPHFYKNYFEVEYEEVIKRTIELNNLAKKNGININILPGQEVFLDKHTIDLYERGIIGTLNNSKYMLVEFPMNELPNYIIDIIYELRIRGVVPIIAHPERYEYVVKNQEMLNDFIEEKCLFQINAGSICGKFGKRINKTAVSLIEKKLCDFIGSDAHSHTSRKLELSEAMLILSKMSEKKTEIIKDNCRKVLKNEYTVSKHEKIKVKRGIFNILRK